MQALRLSKQFFCCALGVNNMNTALASLKQQRREQKVSLGKHPPPPVSESSKAYLQALLQTHVFGQQLLVVTNVTLPWGHLLLVAHPDLV